MEEIQREYYTTQQEIDAMQAELAAAEEAGRAPRPAPRFGRIIGTGVFLLVTMALVFVLVNIWMDKAADRAPDVLGFQIYCVETGSMEPTLPVGTYIVSRIPSDPTALAVGDIVTFLWHTGDKVVTHRIIEVIDSGEAVQYRTKGDNPVNSPDPELLTPDRVRAVYCFTVPFLHGGAEKPAEDSQES